MATEKPLNQLPRQNGTSNPLIILGTLAIYGDIDPVFGGLCLADPEGRKKPGSKRAETCFVLGEELLNRIER
jgi:hypothetical protein